jgi:hypothetical protein
VSPRRLAFFLFAVTGETSSPLDCVASDRSGCRRAWLHPPASDAGLRWFESSHPDCFGPFDFWRGRRSFKPARGDRNPYGLLMARWWNGRHAALRKPCPPGVRVQVPPWLLDFPGWSNGRTAGFDPAGVGSRPASRVPRPPELDHPGGETAIARRFERRGPGSTPGRGIGQESGVSGQGSEAGRSLLISVGTCSWESSLPPKQAKKVRLLPSLLTVSVAEQRQAPPCQGG